MCNNLKLISLVRTLPPCNLHNWTFTVCSSLIDISSNKFATKFLDAMVVIHLTYRFRFLTALYFFHYSNSLKIIHPAAKIKPLNVAKNCSYSALKLNQPLWFNTHLSKDFLHWSGHSIHWPFILVWQHFSCNRFWNQHKPRARDCMENKTAARVKLFYPFNQNYH